ncbi:testis-expressed protein 11 [Phycodurus eques]|uniref:testis-expressed protein 11 n=1 Tax=Phycodurus eques TaxID=693459 RepID=UPI002ACD7C62|nr:testis-expressed protein 11 [Phycodurus eques]
MERFVSSVTRLTAELVQNQQTNSSEVIDMIFSEVSALKDDVKIVDLQLEECAIQLWNWAVTKNVGDSISISHKAKARHAACSLLYCSEPVNLTEGAIRKKIMMASRTGRTWLDCRNPQIADNFLRLAVKSLETLYNQLTSRGHDTLDIDSSKMDVEKDLLRILSFQAESAIIQGRNQEAVAHVQRCKDMLQRLPTQTTFLSLKCYNFGIDTYHHQQFEESTFWLRESYDISKIHVEYAPELKVQAKVLRLLATAYFEWDSKRFHKEALSAVDMANKKCVSATGLYLKFRILLICGASDESIRAGLDEMLKSQVSLDVCLSTVKLLMSEDREVPAFELLKRASQHFQSSPDLGTALVLHIELLLKRGKELLGKQKIEDVITVHYTGKQLAPQDLTTLHAMLWDKASQYVEATDYSEALHWYNYSLRFFKAGEIDSNLAKLQRNRSSCFMHLKQLEKAKEAINEAERCDPDSIFTHFSVYKIAVYENDVERAAKAVNMMAHLSKGLEATGPVSEKATSNLLCLAAQIALENKQQDMAIKLLEGLCETSKDEALVLMALRCLVRLMLPTIETSTDEKRYIHLDVLLPYLKMALKKLSQWLCLTVEQCTEEANWFRKIAWNSALLCERNPDRMRDFFVLSYQLSQMCRPDRTILMAQKTCLLMAVAAALEFCRSSPSVDRTKDLSQALEHIALCAELWKTLKATGSFPKDPTDTLLLLYEFAARAQLNDPKVTSVLESILEQDNVEAKVLETIAGLATEPPAHFPLLSKKALRVALSVHKKQPQVDLVQYSKCIHSLIKLSLPNGASHMEAHLLHEAWDYYDEALAVIAAAPDSLPEMQILWLLTRAWNTGILLYSLARYVEAEKWCSLAMSFVRHLGPLQESYKTQMSNLYSKILDRLDRAKSNTSIKEE